MRLEIVRHPQQEVSRHDPLILQQPGSDASNLDSGHVCEAPFSRVFDFVCTILLGIGSQGAHEDRSASLIPHA